MLIAFAFAFCPADDLRVIVARCFVAAVASPVSSPVMKDCVSVDSDVVVAITLMWGPFGDHR